VKRFLLFLIFLSFFLFAPIKNINAASDSPSDYKVSYTVYENENTHVNMQISLTNQEDDSFFSSYKLQIGYTDINNLKASDSKGEITPNVIKNQKGSTIELSFNDKVVGEGEKLIFYLSFDTKEITENRGNVWEINIPGISSKNDFNSFNVNVYYPKSFGKPVYIKPNIPGALSKNELSFTKEELQTSGISIAFGNYQIYSFDLSYNLKNSNLYPVKTEIAIPPETNYQEIIINDMIPKPNNITVDKDGNWLAEYSLSASETKRIRILGKAKAHLIPKEEKISDEQKKEYLLPKKYWEVNDLQIKKLAKELKNPYAIYQYVVKNLTYDFSKVTSKSDRIGAKKVLENPKSSVCLEFTDLFIALSRAAGIPAREINGFAYTKNAEERPISLVKDVLHAWPEYYDEALNTWIMIDPTWENTTGGIDYFFVLDTDHFAFIRKGIDSSYPVPPGGYKLSENNNQKDVLVELDSTFEKIESFDIKADFPNPSFSAIPIKGSVKIINTGNSLIENKEMNINTKFLSSDIKTFTINKILPFSYQKLDVSFEKTPFLTKTKDVITIQIDKKEIHSDVLITPFYFNKNVILGGIICAIFIIIISLIIYGSRRIFIPKSK